MRPINPLRRWHRRTTDAAGLPLLVSGVVWLALHYSVGAGVGELPHPLEATAMRWHGAAAMLALFVFGLLAAHHVPHGWRVTQGRQAPLQRCLGLVLCVLAGLLVLSGYALYYGVGEDRRAALGLLHSAVGGLMALALVGHRRYRQHRQHRQGRAARHCGHRPPMSQ